MLKQQHHLCPCGSNEVYTRCCKKFISENQKPDTAEQLMRSRYSAYVLKDENYLLQSWHESTRPKSLDLQNDKTQWKKLVIVATSENRVHFIAYFKNNKKLYALSEKSEFKKEKENWFYLLGKELQTIELSKNMLCPCQSGKKFKRCCEGDLKY